MLELEKNREPVLAGFVEAQFSAPEVGEISEIQKTLSYGGVGASYASNALLGSIVLLLSFEI